MSLTDGAAEISQSGRSRFSVLAVGTLWAYGRRLFQIATFVAFGVVCCSWAAASRLDAPIEVTVLCIIGTIALSIVLVDPVAPLTAPSLLPLGWRRVIPAVFGLGIGTSTWVIARSLAAATGPAPWPDGWSLLEWATIAASQMAVGAVLARRRPDSVSFGPGMVVALSWYIVVASPRLHQQLFDPPDHLWRWLALLATFTVVACVASMDPARRFRAGFSG